MALCGVGGFGIKCFPVLPYAMSANLGRHEDGFNTSHSIHRLEFGRPVKGFSADDWKRLKVSTVTLR